MKCLIIDVVSPAIADELGKFMQVDTKILPTQEELAGMIGDYEVLIMRVDPAINKDILDAAKNLKVIGVCSVGLNHIDMDTAKANGIQVFNAPGLNDNAVAELTIAKMLEISRHTIPACIDVKVNKTEGTGSVTDANGDVIATTPSYPIGGGSTGGNKPSTPDDSTSGSTGTPDEDNRGDVEDSAGTPSTPTVPGSGEIADENITGGNANDCKDGHTWGEAQTTTAATCTVDGYVYLQRLRREGYCNHHQDWAQPDQDHCNKAAHLLRSGEKDCGLRESWLYSELGRGYRDARARFHRR